MRAWWDTWCGSLCFWLSGCCVGLVLVSAAHPQESSVPAPTCEAQVQEQYRHLSTAGLVPQATAPHWGPQLTAISSQLRMQGTRYDIKKNQAELAEQNVAQLLEQLRLLNEKVGALQTEVERLKAPAPPSN